MSIVCVNAGCQRTSSALCYVCDQSFCREHFDEHDHSLNTLLHSLKDRVNDFDDRLDELNDEELIENCYEKIDQWRDECYKSIAYLHQKKCQEIKCRFDENIDRQQKKIKQFQLQITDLLQEEEISSKTINLLKSDVANLEEEMNRLKETTFQIEVQPLKLKKNLITIEEMNRIHFPLKQISRPYRTIDCSNKLPKPLASNEEYLLIYRKKNFSLINRELTLVKQTPWIYGRIWDVSWSAALKRFIIIAHYEVYSLNQETMLIERMLTIPRQNWWSCTSSDRSLFLSTFEHGSAIFEFNFQPSVRLTQRWRSPMTCNKDEWIKDIAYKDETLALTIYNEKSSTKRIELRSALKLGYLWSLELGNRDECHNSLRCCSLNDNQWLVADFDQQCLFHITKEGKLRTTYTYNVSPWYINLFSPNMLAISTKESVNFHTL